MRTVLPAAVVLLGVVGCSSDDQGADIESFDDRYGETPRDQAELLLALENEVQQLIMSCMQAQGFDVPAQVSSTAGGSEFLGTVRDLDQDEFVDRYGYGIVELGSEDLLQIPGDPWTDYRLSLSEPERDAFDTALNGDPAAVDPGGCVREAETEAMGGIMVEQVSLLDMEREIEGDPAYPELERRFVECMRGAGYDEANSFDWGRDEVLTRFQAALAGVVLALEDGSEVLLGEFDGSVAVREIALPDEVQEVGAFERRVAGDDYGCLQPIQDEIDALREPYETRFMEGQL